MIVGEYLPSDEWRIENVLKLQLIMCEVLLMEIGSLLHDHNLESGGGKLLSYDTPGTACAHDHKIHRPFVLEFRHRVATSPALVVFAIVVPKWRIVGHLILEPDQLPSGLVVVAAVLGAGQVSHDGMQADKFKEVGFLDRGQKLNLLLGS